MYVGIDNGVTGYFCILTDDCEVLKIEKNFHKVKSMNQSYLGGYGNVKYKFCDKEKFRDNLCSDDIVFLELPRTANTSSGIGSGVFFGTLLLAFSDFENLYMVAAQTWQAYFRRKLDIPKKYKKKEIGNFIVDYYNVDVLHGTKKSVDKIDAYCIARYGYEIFNLSGRSLV